MYRFSLVIGFLQLAANCSYAQFPQHGIPNPQVEPFQPVQPGKSYNPTPPQPNNSFLQQYNQQQNAIIQQQNREQLKRTGFPVAPTDEEIMDEIEMKRRGIVQLSRQEQQRQEIQNLLNEEKRINEKLQNTKQETLHKQFQSAQQSFTELKSMAEDKLPINLKRAVFLAENPYYCGELSYTTFCKDIENAADFCRKIIQKKGWSLEDKYACNHAIQLYMEDTISFQNGKGKMPTVHYPLRYDFNDPWGEKDYKSMFVTKLIKTNKGQCHSMPLFYKLIANELNTEAYISTIPNHSYIMFKDNRGKWLNYETTNGTLPSQSSYLNYGYIKSAALKYKIFMEPLNDKQTLSQIIIDLASTYESIFGYDKFTWDCADLALTLDENSVRALMIKYNTALIDFQKAANKKKIKSIEEIEQHPDIKQKKEFVNQLQAILDMIGYERPPDAVYQNWRQAMENERINLELKQAKLNKG